MNESSKTFPDHELDPLHEGWHLPHFCRVDTMLPGEVVRFTRSDGSEGLMRTGGPLLAELKRDEASAAEGGTFREPPKARVPRHTPIFKSDSQMRDEGWHATSTTPLVICFCVTLAAWALLIWAAL